MSNLIISNQAISQDNGFFSLNDLHKSSGNEPKHKPVLFFRNAEVQEFVAELEKDGSTAYHTVQGKGKKQGTYACRELVYRYAMWISPKFSLMVIRAFDALNTGAIPCLEDEPRITAKQKLAIRTAIARRCRANKEHYQAIYCVLHERFCVNSYHELKQSDFEAAMTFINGYEFAVPQIDHQQLYEVLADSAVHIREYARMIKVLGHLPFCEEFYAKNCFDRLNDNYKNIVTVAKQMNLTNRVGKPMFEANRINYYGGQAVIFN